MTIFITFLHISVCFILIAVILLQAGKGQGLAGAAFGGGNVDSLLGTKGADFMTKVTTAAAIFFMITCLALSMIETHKSRSLLQTGQNTAPIDVDQIKKALEKVKSEAAKDANAITKEVDKDVAVAQKEAEKVVEEVAETAAEIKKDIVAEAEGLLADKKV